MDIGNSNIFNKKKDENKTAERSTPTNGKKSRSLNDMMHQVGDYDITTSSSGQTKTNKNSDKDESSTSSAKRAAADAIASVGSAIAPTTATSSAASKHNNT